MAAAMQVTKMKKRACALLVLAVALLFPAAAIEFGIEGILGNLIIPWTQETASTGAFSDANIHWGGRAYVGLPLSEDAAILLNYERDPVLRNVLTMSVQFERGITKLSVGPFFGIFNSDTAPFNVGLSTTIRFQWPGVAFASVRSDGAISVGLLADALAAAPQARAEIEAGFYTRNAIVSALVSASQFSTTDADGKALTDALSRYMATVDLFKKNVPYTLLAEAGYELRSKHYAASGLTDALGSLILGVTATVQPVAGLGIKLSFESGVFNFGMDNLKGKSPLGSDFFFTAQVGVSINTDDLPKAKPKTPKAKPPKPVTTPKAKK
jgi:hypothetical protein